MLFKILKFPSNILKNLRRDTKEIIGSRISKKWIKTDKENVTTIDKVPLSDVLKIYNQNFPNRPEKKLIRYSQLFPNIFYVVKYNGRSVGYCSYYIQPTFSLIRIKRSAVIFSIAVDRDFSRKGFGDTLLRESIRELKANNIESIWLFVNAENNAAIGLYKKMGFESTDIIENMYGEGKKGCKMRLLLN